MPRLVPPLIASGSISGREQPSLDAGDTVTLRRWEVEDSHEVMSAFADDEIQRWHFLRIDSPVEAEEWIAQTWAGWRSETVATWAISVEGQAEAVGRDAPLLFGMRPEPRCNGGVRLVQPGRSGPLV